MTLTVTWNCFDINCNDFFRKIIICYCFYYYCHQFLTSILFWSYTKWNLHGYMAAFGQWVLCTVYTASVWQPQLLERTPQPWRSAWWNIGIWCFSQTGLWHVQFVVSWDYLYTLSYVLVLCLTLTNMLAYLTLGDICHCPALSWRFATAHHCHYGVMQLPSSVVAFLWFQRRI